MRWKRTSVYRTLLFLLFVFMFAIQFTSCQKGDVNITVIADLYQCPTDWFLLDWTCYRLLQSRASWATAGLVCDRLGGELTVIHDVFENTWISSLPKRTSLPGSPYFWIGASLSKPKPPKDQKLLRWVDGSEIQPYGVSWAIGEPELRNGECVKLSSGMDSDNWRLDACETLLPFVCQMPACPVNTTKCLGESKCIYKEKICDGVFDCASRSDEFNCPKSTTCSFNVSGTSGTFQSPNHPGNYPPTASCLWLITTPIGTQISLALSEFVTEEGKDFVTVLGGSPLPAKSHALATLSGRPSDTELHYRSSSNFLIVKFTSDLTVEKSGFVANWKAVAVDCGGDVEATENFETVRFGGADNQNPALECIYRISGPKGSLITLDITEKIFDGDDVMYVRDGRSARDPAIAVLNGQDASQNMSFQSTSNSMYLFIRTNGVLTFRFAATCDLELNNSTGTMKTAGLDVTAFPRNQACSWRIRPKRLRPFTIRFSRVALDPMDSLQVFEIESSDAKTVFVNENFTGGSSFVLHVKSGDALIKLVSGPVGRSSAFVASYSVDCPPLTKGDLVIVSTPSRVPGTDVTVSCPAGYELSSQDLSVTTRCLSGGVWSVPRIPQCQPRYCGPAPHFSNTIPVNATSFSYLGVIGYKCLDGFAFESGQVTATIECTTDGTWTNLPFCQPVKCPELVFRATKTSRVIGKVILGDGLDYGSVVNFSCDPGYVRIGANSIVCLSNGTWSDKNPMCERQRCPALPDIINGFVFDKQQDEFFYGDTLSVGCRPGYRLLGGPSDVTCAIDQTFGVLPVCEDVDECNDIRACDPDSTTCQNVPGDYYCKCRSGYSGIPQCRQNNMLGVGAFRPDVYDVTVSGSIREFDKTQIGLSSKGWCGSSSKPSDNWIEIDLKAPKVITAVRILPVVGSVAALASVKSFTFAYMSMDNKTFTAYSEPNGQPLVFGVFQNSTAGTQLLRPIETQVVRIRIQDYFVAPCMKMDLIGCWKQSCMDINECLNVNGDCDQVCVNTPGSFQCGCQDGFQLYRNNGTSNFFLPSNETGYLDGDLLLLNKTCVPQSCAPVMPPLNGVLLTTMKTFRFGDEARFACQFGFEMVGTPALRCIASGQWSDHQPLCIPAQCQNFAEDHQQGLSVDPKTPMVPMGRNVSMGCKTPEYRLPGTATARVRKCVFDRRGTNKTYWLTGKQPTCEVVDCRRPQILPGSFYSNLSKTTYSATFRFACVAPFILSGESSNRDDVVRCTKSGIWDFGSLRCDGPTCSDPGRPADGLQIATSYEESATVRFQCSRPGYVLTDPSPLMCLRQTDCGLVIPVGLSTGLIPDSAIKATSEMPGYEISNLRLGSPIGWCAQPENYTYMELDLGRLFRITAIRLKGVVSDRIAGRVTQLRMFAKADHDSKYQPVEPDFIDNPGSYGALSTVPLKEAFRARVVAVGVLSYVGYPCMKLEFYGCPADSEEKAVVGWNATVPMCVDAEAPRFTSCPDRPVVVHKAANGRVEPVMFDIPVATDNSGRIARLEVRPADFVPGTVMLDDAVVEYIAYDFDGNNASCSVQVKIVDIAPPTIACPKSYNYTMDSAGEYAVLRFNSTTHPVEVIGGSRNLQIIYSPDHVKVSPYNYANITVAVGDFYNNTASCSFEVYVLPSPCADGALPSPDKGFNECRNGKDGQISCTLSCNTGYQFVDGSSQEYSCDPKTGWSPGLFVPDCVPAAGHEAVYDAAVDIVYLATGTTPPSADCLAQYSNFLRSQQNPIAEMISAKCSRTIDVPIVVSSISSSLQSPNSSVSVNAIQAIFKYRVIPSKFSKNFFDLCGLTIDTMFDMSVPSGDPTIKAVSRLTDTTGSCPTLEGTDSKTFRGFTCVAGQVLTKMICLDCPRGMFAPDSAACVTCPPGTYQDEQGRASCKPCPFGTFSPTSGVKSPDACLPTCGFGTYSPNGVVPCTACPKDSYSLPSVVGGATSCIACSAGLFTVTIGGRGPNHCRPQCVPGEFSPTGLAPCSACPQNFVSWQSAARICDECRPTFYTPDSNATTCDEVFCPVDMCMNGGQCEVASHRAICRCLPRFTGAQCERIVGECASQPCFNGGVCQNQNNGYKCVCPAGYTGLQCETDPKDCTSVNCPNRGMCQNSAGKKGFQCLCRKGFTGAFCNETMDPCANGVCMNGGSCERLQMERFHCKCPLGFNGTFCENNIDDCVDEPCANGGTCTDLVHDFRCDCAPPFSGTFCEDKADQCAQVNCNNGFCFEDLGSDVSVPVGRCVCYPGWTGSDCSVMVDNCAGQPCQNNGTCRNILDAQQCACPAGFTGSLCQHKVDYCSGEPCQNGGTCTQENNGFRCQCLAGTIGAHCETDINDCDPSPCHANNTDRCVDLLNNFTCICKPGYSGRACKISPYGCAANRCLNNGTCRDVGDSFNCSCSVGWKGDTCELRQTICDPNPCQNNGICFDVSVGSQASVYCKCPPSFFGKRCEKVRDPCFGNPCMNNGVCNNKSLSGACDCPRDFFGPGCAYEVDLCSAGICKNAAACEDYTIGYSCSCQEGFVGDNCDAREDLCRRDSCPAAASKCLTTRNGIMCGCPFNSTGEDCRKPVNTDFDFHFYDESKSTGVSSLIPFPLNTSALTIDAWVKFSVPGDTGTFLQFFGGTDDARFDSANKLLLFMDHAGVGLSMFSLVSKVFVPYSETFQVNDGSWHHVLFTWLSVDGSWNVTVDSIRVDGGTDYGKGDLLPAYGSVTIGVNYPRETATAAAGSGLLGRMSQVRLWDRVLDFRVDIPKLQNCGATVTEGLLYRMVDVDIVNGKVDISRPSDCFRPILQTQKASAAPALTCPESRHYVAPQGFANATWNLPFSASDRSRADRLITNLPNGSELPPGKHSVSFVRYNPNTKSDAICHFDVFVHSSPCPDMEPPVGGTMVCDDWGPDNLYKRCSVQCNPLFDFPEDIASYFICAADGKWHPSYNSTLLRFPACAPIVQPQRMFSVTVIYPEIACNDQTRQFLKESIQKKLTVLQLDWQTCLAANCPGTNLRSSCMSRTKRETLGNADRGMMFNVTFPAATDPVRNTATKQESTVRSVMEKLLYENKGLDFQSQLPNASPSLSDVVIMDHLVCAPGSVLKENKCVLCALGTFFDGVICQRCSKGTYQDELGQTTCKFCPSVHGKGATTITTGAASSSSCKESCSSGHYFDASRDQCLPCGFSSFQPMIGQFDCFHCPPGKTTINNTAVNLSSCIPDCQDGEEIAVNFTCKSCERGSYRGRGQGPSCFDCPKGFSTRTNRSVSVADCVFPVCGPGSYFDQGSNVCVICPFGFYQPLAEQTSCLQCPDDTTTIRYGATSVERCVSANKCVNGEVTCHENAHCFKNGDGFKCVCKMGFRGDGMEVCDDMCSSHCFNQGRCVKDARGNPFCECLSMFYGERCQSKSETAYIAGGTAGAVLLLILLILLIWMICVRSRAPITHSSTTKIPPYPAIAPGNSNGMLYAIEYPPSCSTATVRSQAYIPYYDNDDAWEMNGYANTAFVNDGHHAHSNSTGDKTSIISGKVPSMKSDAVVYDVVNRHRMQMKEVVTIEPPVDHLHPPKLNRGENGDEHSARL